MVLHFVKTHDAWCNTVVPGSIEEERNFCSVAFADEHSVTRARLSQQPRRKAGHNLLESFRTPNYSLSQHPNTAYNTQRSHFKHHGLPCSSEDSRLFPPKTIFRPQLLVNLRFQEIRASLSGADSAPAADPSDRAIGGARNRRPLGGAMAPGDQDPAQGNPMEVGDGGGDDVIADGAATAAAAAGPSAGAKSWQRKRFAAKAKPSAGGDGAAVDGVGKAEEGGDESAAASAAAPAAARPWQKKRGPAAVRTAASSDQIADETPVEQNTAAAAPAKPRKSRVKPRGSLSPKRWQTKTGGGGVGGGRGDDDGVVVADASLGKVAAVGEGSGRGKGQEQGGGGSVDGLEVGLEHKDWKQRVAVFEVQ